VTREKKWWKYPGKNIGKSTLLPWLRDAALARKKYA
jgi:hypothetical protein